MTRPTRVRIDLAALRNNYLHARAVHGARALAVLKANAYGHGALASAHALSSVADGFAVAFLDEACALREGGIRNPILVLEGCFNASELKIANELDLWVVVHQDEQIRLIEGSKTGRLRDPGSVAEGIPRETGARFNVWLKIDTGMSRAGFHRTEAARAHQRLLDTGKVSSITLMTHFARADEPGEVMTVQQIEAFDAATANLEGARSLCNSAGLLAWPSARRDWARPGLMLYGVTPQGPAVPELQPVMTFESSVFAVRTLEPGESLGYGATFVATARTRVGLVCAGYADGYPQTAATGTPVGVDGHMTKLIGRVSMDMLTVDLTDVPNAGVGSVVEFWGSRVPVAMVAKGAGRSPYEVLCAVKRAPLVHENAGQSVREPLRMTGTR